MTLGRWIGLLEQRDYVPQRAGAVVLEFKLHQDGRVTDMKVVDSNGASSAAVTGPAITVRTVSAVDNPPVITLAAVPQIVAGTNSTYQNVPIAFTATAVDVDGDTGSLTTPLPFSYFIPR